MIRSRVLGLFGAATALAMALGGIGCGDDAQGSGGDSNGGGQGGGGAGEGGASVTFPAPIVAGTPETDALADSPMKCGAPAYAWLRDPTLGEVVDSIAKDSYTADLLQALLDATGRGADLPPMSYDVATHLVTYTTQDRGELAYATAVIAWPTSAPEGTELPTLLFLHGTSGFTDGCGPSADPDAVLLAAALASIGYVVVVPDYLGLKGTPPDTGFPHPYLVGEPTAIASLDAVRALGSMEARGLAGSKPSPRVAVVGGSQGGHAALWVDRLAPYYARELEIVGVAATVPPSDMVGESNLALQTLRSSSGNMVAFFGVSADWYGLGDRLGEVFVPPLDVEVPIAMAESCDPTEEVENITELSQIFQPALLEAAANDAFGELEPWGCLSRENGLTTTSVARISKDPPSYGVLFVTGESDTLVDTPSERAAFATLCTGGLPATYLECSGASHTAATAWALPTILEFLSERVAGEPFATNCNVSAPVLCPGTPPVDP